MVNKIAPLQPTGEHSRADTLTATYGGPHARAVDVPWKKLQPIESPHWNTLLTGSRALGEEAHEGDVLS